MVFSHIDELEPVAYQPAATHPIVIRAIRVAGEPAGGEPVKITLTEAQALWLIGKLADALAAVNG